MVAGIRHPEFYTTAAQVVVALLIVNVVQARSYEAYSRRMRISGAVNVVSTCWSALVALALLAGFVSDSLGLRISIVAVVATQFMALIFLTLRPQSSK
jgi:hypothetical protein